MQVPEWLADTVSEGGALPTFAVLTGRIGLSLLLGFLVAGVYVLTRGQREGTKSLSTTLVLLSVLIAMVTLVIGNSVARAFGLVGALSIVRFRTVVEDTRDTAFVIFAVAVGMAAGAGYASLAVVGIPVVAVAAGLMKLLEARSGDISKTRRRSARLTIRVGLGQDPESLVQPILSQHAESWVIESIATARQGAALEVTLLVQWRMDRSEVSLVQELNRVEGVQSVELHVN